MAIYVFQNKLHFNNQHKNYAGRIQHKKILSPVNPRLDVQLRPADVAILGIARNLNSAAVTALFP